MDLEEKKERIIELIKKNPNFTYKKIRAGVGFHIEGIFKNGLQEAFEKARVIPPRNFKRRKPEETRKIIIDYIQKHPGVGGHTIRKDTKINFSAIFPTIEEAYAAAGVEYPRKIDERLLNERRQTILNLIKEKPEITLEEIMKEKNLNPYSYFSDLREAYRLAGVPYLSKGQKRNAKKRKVVIQFIKDNPLATHREINNSCKTHIQDLFSGGIQEAYKSAGVDFPYERLVVYGTAKKEIRKRAAEFEESIALKLSCYGRVYHRVKTKRGYADIILERKDKKTIIEVKDYESKDISISEIKQLNKYLEDCNCNLGFLVCVKKPKKDSFLIGKNKIIILDDSELNKIPELLDGCIG